MYMHDENGQEEQGKLLTAVAKNFNPCALLGAIYPSRSLQVREFMHSGWPNFLVPDLLCKAEALEPQE